MKITPEYVKDMTEQNELFQIMISAKAYNIVKSLLDCRLIHKFEIQQAKAIMLFDADEIDKTFGNAGILSRFEFWVQFSLCDDGMVNEVFTYDIKTKTRVVPPITMNRTISHFELLWIMLHEYKVEDFDVLPHEPQ